MELNEKTIKVNEVVFQNDLYPRSAKLPEVVQQYAEDISVLPPIEVNQDYVLIDGWNRWTAHQKMGVKEIRVFVTETSSDLELFELAAERNSKHGRQLTFKEKEDVARRIYHTTPYRERSKTKERLALSLKVSERTVGRWLARIDKDDKVKRDKKIRKMWMACYTQEEIAEECECTHQTVSNILQKIDTSPKLAKPAARHEVDFEVPIFNIWKCKEKTTQSKHPGNTEITILDNLLYLYTKPFDVVVDPFAGSGSTINVCKKRSRRYFVSDLVPIIERTEEIRQHDIVLGRLPLSRWKDVRLVYLDPPYWIQQQGNYSDLPNDLSNMELDQFHDVLVGVIDGFAEKLSSGSFIALIILDTQWKAPDKKDVFHSVEMIKRVKLSLRKKISCPYESQQCTAQMVTWAQDNKDILNINRELLVWEK